MKRSFLPAGALALLLALPAAVHAQDADTLRFTPTEGAREFTFGASGATNQDFNDSFGGLAASYSQYLNRNVAVAFRQTIDYFNAEGGGDGWGGSTRVAIDYHFPNNSRLLPFVGVSFGGMYGDTVADTWAAGIEAGVKHYVRPQTFLFVMADYSWLFDDADDVEDRFDTGAFFWNAGVGFNF